MNQFNIFKGYIENDWVSEKNIKSKRKRCNNIIQIPQNIYNETLAFKNEIMEIKNKFTKFNRCNIHNKNKMFNLNLTTSRRNN